MTTLVAIIKEPKSSYSVVFENDGNVAYAYLRDGQTIISDVWLYNSGVTPDQPEWSDRSRMPFTNPKGFTVDETAPHVLSASDVAVTWNWKGSTLSYADVLLSGEVYGRLAPGAKPGWARLASREGPVARPLKRPT